MQAGYSPLTFDTDAAYSVIPRLIPWEFECKLSEKVEEEIDKTFIVVEESLQRIEGMPRDLGSMEMLGLSKGHEVPKPVMCRKRTLFKNNPSFLDATEVLDYAKDVEDFLDISDFPETNTQLRVKRRTGIVLSSQSDDGSGDELPCTDIVNGHQMPDMSTAPDVQTGIFSFLDIPFDPICRYESKETLQEPLENFGATSISHICDTFQLQNVSCVPESSFVFGSESNREDDFLAVSSHNSSFVLADSISPVHILPGDPDSLDRTIIEFQKCLEDNAGNTCDVDLESVHGNEEQGDSQNGHEPLPRRYQLMDECSRADFPMQLLPGSTGECPPQDDPVQQTWRKLRCNQDDLKAYLPANRKDVSQILLHMSGVADLISEADIMFKSCYPLVNVKSSI